MRVNDRPSPWMASLAVVSLFAFLLNSVAEVRSDPPSKRPSAVLPSRGLTFKSPGARPQGAPSPMMQMPMVIPLFIQNQDFSSKLVLTNAANQATYADVILTGTNGREITSQRVQFSPHSQSTVDIQSLLMSAVSPATTGSITIMQDPQFVSTMVILGQLSMTYRASDRMTYIDEEVAMPSSEGSQTLRAVANSGDGSPLVAVTNLSEMAQHVVIHCLTERGQGLSKSVTLSASETLLTEACSEQTNHGAVMESFSRSDSEAPHGPIGISLTTDGMPGTIAAFGLQSHKAADNHFYTNVTFVDPMMLVSPGTVFDGVPVGRASLLSPGNYVPELSLTNFSAKNLQVTMQYAQSSGTTPETKQLASINIPAGSSKRVTFGDLQGDPGLQNSFLISSTGAPGDVLAKLVSKNDSAPEEVELFGKDAMDTNNGGSNPWSIQNGTQSTLLFFNHDQAPQIFDVLIASADGTQWQKDFTLSPMETQAISIGNIIQNAVKDDSGKTLPKTAISGQISWWTVGTASGPGAGRLLQSNSESGTARSFACGCPYILCGVDIFENLQAILFGDTGTPLDTVNGTICMYKTGGHCSGVTSSNSSSQALHYSWTADGTYLQVSGSSTNSSVNAYGASVGTGGMTGQVSATYLQPPETCTFQGSGSTPVTPAILLGGPSGTNITNNSSNPQSEVVGQQIILYGSYALPSGSTLTSQSWTIPGTGSNPPTAISNFTYTVGANTSTGGPVFLTPSQLGARSVTFYFIAPANSQQVTFTLNYSVNGTPQPAATAKATFNIAGPTPSTTNAPFVTTQLGQVAINSGPFLQFGGTTDNIGIQYTASANQPTGYSPVFKWVNLISNDTLVQIDTNGTLTTNLGSGLDSGYPSFPNITATTTYDNPRVSLLPACTEEKRTFAAQTYLMWNAGLTSPVSIDVPLGSLNWGFSGDAVQNSGMWSLSGTPSDFAVGFTNSSSYPAWSSLHAGGSTPPCP